MCPLIIDQRCCSKLLCFLVYHLAFFISEFLIILFSDVILLFFSFNFSHAIDTDPGYLIMIGIRWNSTFHNASYEACLHCIGESSFDTQKSD